MQQQDPIYVNAPFEVRLKTEYDLTLSIAIQIAVQRPDLTTTTFSATIDSNPTKMYHLVTSTENNQAGTWNFQALVNLGNGYIPGSTYTVYVQERFTLAAPNNT